LGRNAERLQQVAAHCRTAGADLVEIYVVDVRDRSGMDHILQSIDEKYPLDLVIANAGISGGTGGADIKEIFDQAQNIFDVNVGGVLNTIHPILKKMIERKSGQIAVMSSMVSFSAWPGAPAYSASKAAVRFYGEALRAKLLPHNVKINVICPGFVESEMTKQNSFSMPFIIKSEYAAQLIADGIEKNKARIWFPFPIILFANLLRLLPLKISLIFLSLFPEKNARPKSESN
jgi:short-subunit dehydrogenase